jgi:hypothetical protein
MIPKNNIEGEWAGRGLGANVISFLKRITCLVLLFGFSVGYTQAQTPATTIPNFTFFKLDGTPFSTKQIPSHKASLFSFFDVTCSHCQLTMRTLSKHYSELKGISVFLVSLDRKDAILKFMKTYGPGFLNKPNVIILQDLNYEFIPKFQPVKYPSVFLYNKHKKLEVYERDEKKMLQVITKAGRLK